MDIKLYKILYKNFSEKDLNIRCNNINKYLHNKFYVKEKFNLIEKNLKGGNGDTGSTSYQDKPKTIEKLIPIQPFKGSQPPPPPPPQPIAPKPPNTEPIIIDSLDNLFNNGKSLLENKLDNNFDEILNECIEYILIFNIFNYIKNTLNTEINSSLTNIIQTWSIKISSNNPETPINISLNDIHGFIREKYNHEIYSPEYLTDISKLNNILSVLFHNRYIESFETTSKKNIDILFSPTSSVNKSLESNKFLDIIIKWLNLKENSLKELITLRNNHLNLINELNNYKKAQDESTSPSITKEMQDNFLNSTFGIQQTTDLILLNQASWSRPTSDNTTYILYKATAVILAMTITSIAAGAGAPVGIISLTIIAILRQLYSWRTYYKKLFNILFDVLIVIINYFQLYQYMENVKILLKKKKIPSVRREKNTFKLEIFLKNLKHIPELYNLFSPEPLPVEKVILEPNEKSLYEMDIPKSLKDKLLEYPHKLAAPIINKISSFPDKLASVIDKVSPVVDMVNNISGIAMLAFTPTLITTTEIFKTFIKNELAPTGTDLGKHIGKHYEDLKTNNGIELSIIEKRLFEKLNGILFLILKLFNKEVLDKLRNDSGIKQNKMLLQFIEMEYQLRFGNYKGKNQILTFINPKTNYIYLCGESTSRWLNLHVNSQLYMSFIIADLSIISGYFNILKSNFDFYCNSYKHHNISDWNNLYPFIEYYYMINNGIDYNSDFYKSILNIYNTLNLPIELLSLLLPENCVEHHLLTLEERNLPNETLEVVQEKTPTVTTPKSGLTFAALQSDAATAIRKFTGTGGKSLNTDIEDLSKSLNTDIEDLKISKKYLKYKIKYLNLKKI